MSAKATSPVMDIEARTRQLVDSINNQHLKGVLEFFSTDVKFIGPATDYNKPLDKEGLRKTFEMIMKAVPDARISIRDMVTSADKVEAKIIFKGKHSGGDLWDITPSSNRVEVTGHLSLSMDDSGQFKETWLYLDHLGILQQVGESAYQGIR
jgi:predicted ester cyclase